MTPFHYESATVPPQYHCAKCRVPGVKLWRTYVAVMLPIPLTCASCTCASCTCASCACAEQSVHGRSRKVAHNAEGAVVVTTTYDPDLEPVLYAAFREGDRDMNQIGRYVPAIPTEDGVGYWGFTAVPEAGIRWWRNLPLCAESRP